MKASETEVMQIKLPYDKRRNWKLPSMVATMHKWWSLIRHKFT